MKQWAILVGLDGYQSFQPLNCAQQDVQALHQFLVSEAGFPLNQCLLFTERSPFLSGRSTYPSQENLCNWFEFLAQNYFQPDDQVWIFLNGYGVCHRGQDYFVPIDGDPAAIAATCIAIAPLIARLKAALPQGQPLLLLDINRSQATISHETVGIQTAQIAHQIGISTILSCQPGQFSHESSLGHGLFTATLLEGLRYQQGATLETLSHYLSDRLPELSEHYWQPSQNPVTICPPHLVHKPLLSLTASSWKAATNGHIPHSSAQNSQAQNSPQVHSAVKTLYPTAAFALPAVNVPPAHSGSQADASPSRANPIAPLPAGQNPSDYTAIAAPVSNHSVQVESLENSYRGDATLTGNVPPKLDAVKSEPTSEPTSEPSQEEISLWRPFLLWGGLISVGLLSAVLWRNWSVVLAAPASQQLSATETMQPVSTSARIKNPSESQALKLKPSGFPQRVSDGAVILQSARAMVQTDQATPYRDAIQQARRIQAIDQFYPQAQQDIANWSQTIYNIAQERASRNQFNIAVMAADLVPLEDRNLRSQADAAIAQWCQSIYQQNSQPIPQQANSICRS